MRTVLACLAMVAAQLPGQADVAALRDLAAARPEVPEVHYNLALAEWRAGDLAAAELAIEKYAALAAQPRADLHGGMLGAIRYAEAERLLAAESPDLSAALKAAEAALAHFVRAAIARPTPELRRNAERTLRLLEELRKRMQQDPAQDSPAKDGEQRKDGDAEDGKDESQQGKSQPSERPNPDDPTNEAKPAQGGGAAPEPSPQPEAGQSQTGQPEAGQPEAGQPEAGQPEAGQPEAASPEPSQRAEPEAGGESKSPSSQPGNADADTKESTDASPRNAAPGETNRPLRLSQEQAKRLMDQLQKLDAQLQAVRSRSIARRPKVEKDW
ncbi:MAG: hypothetical protein RL398_1768 [Planctomycetota bacterium]